MPTTMPGRGDRRSGLQAATDAARTDDLVWTAEPPTVSGWYWTRRNHPYWPPAVQYIQVRPGWVRHDGPPRMEYAGPIPLPAEPIAG